MTAWWLADLTWEIVQSCLPAPGPAPAPFLSEECSSLRVGVSDTGSDSLAPAPAPGTGAGRRVFRTRETGLAGPAAATNDVLRDLPWLRAVYTLSLAPMRWGDQTPHVSPAPERPDDGCPVSRLRCIACRPSLPSNVLSEYEHWLDTWHIAIHLKDLSKQKYSGKL